MLQSAARNREAYSEYAPEHGDLRDGLATGETLRQAARDLHDALDHMETALSASRARAEAAAAHVREENRGLKAQMEALEGGNAGLMRDLAVLEQRNAQLAGQVGGISQQLEALIGRLTVLLEE